MSELPPVSIEAVSAPGLTAQQRARLLLRLRRGLAALSLVGAALVALPVAQLMRFQSTEIKSLAAKRANLDPIARAVNLQRGLLAHGELAGQVLRGQEKLEADRRMRQTEVDGRMAALNVALASGHWELAMGEADELRNDWLQLARQVLQRQIDAGSSTESHRLLVEQTLQVIDLVTTANRDEKGEAAVAAGDLPAGALVAMRAMPRLVWMTAQLQGREGRLAPLETALARTLKHIAGDSADQDSAATEASDAAQADDQKSLHQAAKVAGAASSLYFGLLRKGAANPEALQTAARGAVQAQMSLFDLAYGQASAALAAQTRAMAQKRALLLGGLCFGVLVALGLVTGLRRDLRTLAADDQMLADAQAAPPASDGQSGGRQQAELLLQRLREGGNSAAAAQTPVPGNSGVWQESPTRRE